MVLEQGPWFISGQYLGIQRWVTNFVAWETTQSFLPIRVWLPNLPTKLYNGIILWKIGDSIGKLLNIDACTSVTLQGRYDQPRVQVSLDQSIETHDYIGSHKKLNMYEGEDNLCKRCGC